MANILRSVIQTTRRFCQTAVFTLGLGWSAIIFRVWADDRPIPPFEDIVHIAPALEVRAAWDQVQPVGARLRIGTYNIQDFVDGVDDGTNSTPERAARHAEAAAKIIAEADPDILVLQEIENAAALELLQKFLPRPYPLAYVAVFSGHGDRPLNLAALARAPIYGVRMFDFARLSGPGRPPRGIISFTAPLDERRYLLVYGVHLKSNFGDSARNRAKRYHALRMLAEDAETTRKMYPCYDWEMMVLGDTNVDPEDPQFADDYSLEPLAAWTDLWRGRALSERVTVPTRYGDPALEFPPCTFDRVFASGELSEEPWKIGPPWTLARGVDTQNVFTVGGENDQHVSDHYPVFVDLFR